MKVSIITVSYNSDKTIKDTFDSIRNQTYKNIEYIVIDGNSTDNSISIFQDNSDIISILTVEKDNGIYDAMNKGIQKATGEIIGILNSDDVYFNNEVIDIVVEVFQNDKTDIVYGDIQYVSNDLSSVIRNWKSSSYIKGEFKKGWQPPHPAFFVKKNIYDKIGKFDLNFDISADFDFMFRALEIGDFKSKYISKIFTKMRIGGKSNNSVKNILRGNQQILKSFKKHKKFINPVIFLFNRFSLKLNQFIPKKVK